ncbi:MAG: DNA methyltransferase [Candidatus Izemoplasmatales bacterium]
MATIDLISDLKAKENIEEYWDFRRNDQRSHVHSMIKYPAVMVPNMQGEIFDLVLKNDSDIRNVLDPFMGSGTILIEGLVRNLNVVGIDINPLSYLTVLAKTQTYSKNILRIKSEQLIKRIENINSQDVKLHCFDGINKWYVDDVIRDLSKIRSSILQESEVKYRRFFWVAFAEIAKQADNSRTSTFKLHIKLDLTIKETEYDCIQSFKEKLYSNVNAIVEFKALRRGEKERIYYGDSKRILRDRRRFAANSIDLVITSPPYGDNATTITYGQYSVLPLRWVPLADIHDAIVEDVITNLSRIDRSSLGGVNYQLEQLLESGILQASNQLNDFVSMLLAEKMTDKARKVASFILDFSEVLQNLSPVVKPGKLLIFTVGNRHVNKTEFPLHLVLRQLAEVYGMNMLYDFRRNIIKNKNYVDTSVQGFKTINKETIMILQKRI